MQTAIRVQEQHMIRVCCMSATNIAGRREANIGIVAYSLKFGIVDKMLQTKIKTGVGGGIVDHQYLIHLEQCSSYAFVQKSARIVIYNNNRYRRYALAGNLPSSMFFNHYFRP